MFIVITKMTKIEVILINKHIDIKHIHTRTYVHIRIHNVELL
jgi:hypothetical protein